MQKHDERSIPTPSQTSHQYFYLIFGLLLIPTVFDTNNLLYLFPTKTDEI